MIKLRHVWTKEEEKFVRDNIKGKSRIEMTEMFNNHFGTDVTVDKMKGFCSRKKITNGRDCRFKKGCSSWNKGKSMPAKGRSAETQFKKGHIPDNAFPIGTIKPNTDGYLFIKVKRSGSKYECWKAYSRYLWEQKHGPIPKGHCLIFLNKDKRDCREENIALVSRAELARLNKIGLTTKDRDLTKAGISFIRLLSKQEEVQKKLNA
ncbi:MULTISPECIES: HNH endonuclease signature motif containing protein [Staphylococcus]|uniref:HNH endonuclease signature motif containing protein n=1 Tax=Staphylococcus TaxID=1279 RepID=UPI001E4C1C82|nr:MULTISPECIES: HNH endonuclease signature motif containing protein [Staphylococcus]MCD8921980.1 HNH endonuclease [Staphylococcus epidermidis]MCD9056278.1 HNH endonuclease [Staphylococcus epidermidis]MEB5736990.1 HNH endonuclease [Staphylococcus epidermidis]MEB7070159.1 HNH endonuclease [Staphylococcus epidermidis]MEB7387039.1 HNH endonuclease [Staphylococcus epidermidis]